MYFGGIAIVWTNRVRKSASMIEWSEACTGVKRDGVRDERCARLERVLGHA